MTLRGSPSFFFLGKAEEENHPTKKYSQGRKSAPVEPLEIFSPQIEGRRGWVRRLKKQRKRCEPSQEEKIKVGQEFQRQNSVQDPIATWGRRL